jgi:aminoglycoside phosphotransferase (APT) family kinase protein
MRPPSLSAHEVEALAREVLGMDDLRAEHVPFGYGNENWRVTDTAGRSFIVKIGSNESFAKWKSASAAYELAASVGVPAPALVSFTTQGDHVVRVFEWIDGDTPTSPPTGHEQVAAWCAGLGRAIAGLHSIELDAFGSRLDGSAPSFGRWSDYIDYRVEQIRGRCSENGAVDLPTLDLACAAIRDIAAEVTGVVRPTLCHRDLYADNLLVDEQGTLVAILDWDMAEAWDPAGEWFKLDWLLFPAFPGSESAFSAAYHAIHPEPPRWARRKQLVDLMESLNAIPNAATQPWNSDFEAQVRARLQVLLGST